MKIVTRVKSSNRVAEFTPRPEHFPLLPTHLEAAEWGDVAALEDP